MPSKNTRVNADSTNNTWSYDVAACVLIMNRFQDTEQTRRAKDILHALSDEGDYKAATLLQEAKFHQAYPYFTRTRLRRVKEKKAC